MKRLRVMHVVVGGDIGGAERVVVDLASRPGPTGADHEVALFTPNRSLASYFADAGLRVHDRGPSRENPMAYLLRSLGPADVAWLAGVVVTAGADVVHTHTFASHVLGTRASRRAGRPQLRTEHHVMHYFDPSSSPFTRWAAARTDRLIAVSDYVRRIIIETAPPLAERMTVVRNGVDSAHFRPLEGPTDPSVFRAGIVCRLTAWKRVHLAIEAAALTGIELLVIGDGEERSRLEAVAKKRSAPVRFTGYEADPRPWVAECAAIVSTSDREPLGLSVLEALAMERPVVAYAAGGIPEIVQDGVSGILVNEPTAAALAEALDRARCDRVRLRSMGLNGRRFAVDQCSIERMCEGYGDAYRLVSGRR